MRADGTYDALMPEGLCITLLLGHERWRHVSSVVAVGVPAGSR